MQVDCIYVANTVVGDYCALNRKECTYLQDCKYYSRMADDYREEDNE